MNGSIQSKARRRWQAGSGAPGTIAGPICPSERGAFYRFGVCARVAARVATTAGISDRLCRGPPRVSAGIPDPLWLGGGPGSSAPVPVALSACLGEEKMRTCDNEKNQSTNHDVDDDPIQYGSTKACRSQFLCWLAQGWMPPLTHHGAATCMASSKLPVSPRTRHQPAMVTTERLVHALRGEGRRLQLISYTKAS